MPTALFTAAASLYTSTIPYRQGAPGYPGSSMYLLTQCDKYYNTCEYLASDTYTYCSAGCVARGVYAEACQTGCKTDFDNNLSQCRQLYYCHGKGECQVDVQNPLGAPPKCCPPGYLNCASTCVPDCPDTARIDPPTCTCQCIPVACPPPKTQDSVTCGCVCPPCPDLNYVQDPSTCECTCRTDNITNGHCCGVGQKWWHEQCCDIDKCALVTTGLVDGRVSSTEERCCSET